MWQDHHGGVSKPVYSENRRYSLEIQAPGPQFSNPSRDPLKLPELLVFEHRRDGKELLWRKAVPWALRHGMEDFFHPFRSRACLTNDGRTAVVWIEVFGDPPVLSILSKDHEAALDISDLLTVLPPVLDQRYEFNWLVSHESLDLLGRFDSGEVYSLWLRPLKQWIVVPLDEPSFKIPSPQLSQQLHMQMLQGCRERVQMYEARKAAKEKPRDVIDFSDIANAYRFLGTNGNPADKVAAERLLATQFRGGGCTCPPFGFAGMELTLHFACSDRALGAELITNWAKPDNVVDSRPRGSRQTFFGELGGVIRFPFRLPNPPGTLVLSIIPLSGAADGSVPTPIRVEFVLPEDPPDSPMGRKGPRPNQLSFRVGTLTPGEYRLKALWERRTRMQLPPWVQQGATADSKGGAYESAESEAISVDGGERVEGIQLACIHRTSADPALYINDQIEESWVSLSKIEKSKAPPQLSSHSQSEINLLFSGPAQAGLVNQQQSEAKIILREMRLEQFPGRGTNGGKQLKVTFIHLGLIKRKLRFEAELKDDQSTRYEGAVFGFRAIKEIWFSVVPLKSKLFTITIFTFDEDTDDSSDLSRAYRDTFKLQNLLPISENGLTPESLPTFKVLDLVTIELRELKTSRWTEPGSREIDPVFAFFEEGRESPSWRVHSLSYEDSLGNVASSPDGLPANEGVLKLHATFARNIHTGRFDQQEQWQIEIPRIPTTREFLDLQRSWQFPGGVIDVFGIGGPGVFRYEEGKVLSARDLSSEEQEPLRIDETGDEGAHFRVSGNSGFSASLPLSESGAREVVSRWPHLVFRKTLSKFGMDIRVKEEAPIGNWACFHRPPQLTEMAFVPLFYQPGELSKTVTIVAQRPRDAEFVVRLPGSD